MASYVIGVTGGVASGKSAVATRFELLGVTIVDADLIARAVVAPGEDALADIKRRFGEQMLLANGMLDRVRMRELVFTDPQARRDLESITHPRIRKLMRAGCRQAQGSYVLAVIPLLAEAGVAETYDWLDRTLVVDAPVALQRERLMARDHVDRFLADQMIASQASRAERLALATDVLVNDGPSAWLDIVVSRLHARFCKPVHTPSTAKDN